MPILLISDLHSNPAALEALREVPLDTVLCLGDLVEYGVEPAPCIAWVRRHCHHWVRGNHDHGAAHGVRSAPNNSHGFKYLTSVTRPLNRQRLGNGDRQFLASMPLTQYLTLDGVRYLLVHATPRDPLDEFAPPDPDLWSRRLAGIDVDVVCCGHTHKAYTLEVNGTLVINPGSIGLQRDGDPRASFAVIEGREVTLHRAEYNIDRAVQAVIDAPMPDDVKDLLTNVYRNGKLPERDQVS